MRIDDNVSWARGELLVPADSCKDRRVGLAHADGYHATFSAIQTEMIFEDLDRKRWLDCMLGSRPSAHNTGMAVMCANGTSFSGMASCFLRFTSFISLA